MNSRLVIYYIVKGFFPFFSWLICFKCVFSPLVITTFQLNPTAMPSCQGFFSFYVCASNYLLEKFGCNEKFANKHYNYKFHSKKTSSIHRFQNHHRHRAINYTPLSLLISSRQQRQRSHYIPMLFMMTMMIVFVVRGAGGW